MARIDIKALKSEIRTAKADLKPLTRAAKAACKAEDKQINKLTKLEAKLADAMVS